MSEEDRDKLRAEQREDLRKKGARQNCVPVLCQQKNASKTSKNNLPEKGGKVRKGKDVGAATSLPGKGGKVRKDNKFALRVLTRVIKSVPGFSITRAAIKRVLG